MEHHPQAGAVHLADTPERIYNPSWYNLDAQVLAELRRLEPHRPILAALHAWFWIIVIVKAFTNIPAFLYFYPVVIFLIAGRAGVFLQLAHEASHGLISKGAFNTWFGNWIACYPLGLHLKGYQEGHTVHHACTNQACDPANDREKYRICDIRDPKLWLLFLKDVTGITALGLKLRYDTFDPQHHVARSAEVAAENQRASLRASLGEYPRIALVQLIIIGAVFNFNLLHYIALWLVPLTVAHAVLMRIRGIAEHGLGIQLGVTDLDQRNRGTLYTRSFGTPARRYRFRVLNWIEIALIGSLNVYYHHEHHVFPKVPYYHLPRLHALIAAQEQAFNPQVFARGYFECLFAAWRLDRGQS